ncbi:MAG: leucine-rich repeat protein [Promethearchaeia archaeon]
MIDKIRINGIEIDFPRTDTELKLKKLNIKDFKNVNWSTASNRIKTLHVENCHIQSFEGIENLENLESLKFYEYSDFDPIRILKGLSNLPNLRNLTLSSKNFYNLDGLENLPKLEQLTIGFNNFKKIPIISIFPKLRELDLAGNKISKIEGVDNNLNLNRLNLNSNTIAKIEGLNNCINLKTLSIGNNKLVKIEGLEACINLERLYLSGNNISMIEGLDTLENLEIIHLKKNNISKIESIKHLSKLQLIDLSDNQITNIDDLPSLIHQNIKTLILNNNQIQDARVLRNFPFETKILIKENPIIEIHCLYCDVIALDKEDECEKRLNDLILKYIKNIPVSAKGKPYSVETGGYFSLEQGKYVKSFSLPKRDTIILKRSEIFSRGNVKKLKGPLCENCMNLYLNETEGFLKKLSTSDKAAKIIKSTKKVREEFNKNWIKWQKKIN